LLLATAAIAALLSLYRLGDPLLTILVVVPTLAIGPLLYWHGRRTNNLGAEAAGILLSYLGPAMAFAFIAYNALVQHLQ
jgi:hypothetical protein